MIGCRRSVWGGVLLLLLASGCAESPEMGPVQGTADGTGAAASLPEPGSELMTVETATVARADLEVELMLVGSLEGRVSVEVVPDLAGRLETVTVDLGDRVTVGQPVAQVRDADVRTQVRQATNALEVAQATLRQREVDLALAETIGARSARLFGQNLIAQDALDDAEARAQSAAAQVDLARAQLDQNQARLEELQLLLDEATIRSPVDGFVAKRHLDPGALVSTNAPVISVVDLSRVKLVAQIVERDVRRIRVGAPTRITVDAYPGDVFAGVVARVAPVLDPTTRTAVIEVEVPNPDFRLKPGMYARVLVTTDRRDQALVVPRNALVDAAGGRGVFTVRATPAGHVATFVPIETGVLTGDLVEVLAGLTDGETVVTLGAAGLRDGDRVHLVASPVWTGTS